MQVPRGPAVTARSLIIAFLLLWPNAWWLTQTEYVRYSDNGTTASLFFNAITLLLLLLAWNALIRRRRPTWALFPGEMVVIYIVIAIGTNLAGHDQLQILFLTITTVVRRGAPGTDYGDNIIPLLPGHLIPQDRQAVDDLFNGATTLYRWDHIQPWLGVLGWWTLFALLMVWVMLCMVALLRKQWDAERLTYPVAEVPLQMIADTRSLFRQPLLWVGFAIGMSGQLINLLHTLYPSVPEIPIAVRYFQAPDYPLRAAGNIPISSFPFAYGLAFLLPVQIGFSCWFFFLVSRAEMIFSWMAGYTDQTAYSFPYVRQQGVGAALGLALWLLWTARRSLRHAVRAAFGLEKADDAEEPMSYRTAVFGLALGLVGLIAFAMFAGMRLSTAIYYFAILLAIVLVVSRLRAEVGLPTFEFFHVGADEILNRIGGTQRWTGQEMGVMGLFYWLSRTHRQFPMQSQLDAIRLGQRTNTPLRSLNWVILAASGAGIIVAFWAYLHCVYQVGFESSKFYPSIVRSFGAAPWDRLSAYIKNPVQPDAGGIWAHLFGSVFVAFLAFMRSRFVAWPFHPAGYLVAASFGLFRLWLPIFVSWLVKVIVLRYGGLKGYRTAMGFFIGLVLGEFSAGMLRTILDLIFQLYLPARSGIGGL